RPHGAIIDCLHGLVEHNGRALNQLPSVHRALTKLSGLSPQKNQTHIKETNSKGLLAESIRQALLELSAFNHMCIIVHDVHRTEPTTADISAYLLEDLLADSVFEWSDLEVREQERSPVHGAFIIFSFRTTNKMDRLMNLASTTEAIRTVSLPPLDLAGVKQFLSDDDVASVFLRKSGGMPLTLNQLISSMPNDPDRHLVDRWHTLPQSVTDRLNVLALSGNTMSPRQIDDLVNDGQRSLDVLSEMPELIETHLINGRPTFGFTQSSEQETWRENMDPDIARKLHGKLAEKMAAGLYGEPETIARHFLGAARPEDAIPFIMETVPSLLRAHAFTRASELLNAIVDTASGTLEAEVIMTLIDCFVAMGQHEDAQRMLDRLRQNQDIETETIFMTELSLCVQSEDSTAVRAMQKRLTQLKNDTDTAKALALLADYYLREGDLDEALKLCHQSTACEPPASSLDLLNTLGKIHLFREQFEEAEHIFSDNLAAAQSTGEPQHTAKALINLGVVYLQQGFVDKALLQFKTVKDHCTKEGDIPHLAVALENLAVLHYRKQEFKQALYYYHRSASSSRRLGRQAQFSTTILNLGDLYLTVGDVQKAKRLANIARNYTERGKYRFLEPQLLTLEGDIARHLGYYQEACDSYDQAESLIRAGSLSNQRLIPLLRANSELHLDHNFLDQADQKLSEALSLVSSMHEGLALRLRITHGAILSERGKLQEAQQELEAAVHGATESDDVEALWLALSRLALVRWRLGDLAAATIGLQSAQKATLRLLANLPTQFRELYQRSPNQLRLRQHLDRIARGLEPTNQLESSSKPESQPHLATAPYNEKWTHRYPKMIGRSAALGNVFKLLDRVAGSEGMVLICGESGTGKELVAEALHQQSPRRSGPFVKVNCAAFVETLLLSELFGHEKGAFTGASTNKKGRFELAHGGTLFLDEIGDISPNTQVALLRVLQEGTLDRVGGSETISVDVRVICATHRHLESMVEEGTFRMDLYYRLRGLTIDLPALRHRKSDIPLLTKHFLQHHKNKAAASRISNDALASLIQHDWPGNVRELENIIRSAALFATGERIETSDLIALGNVFTTPTIEAKELVSQWISELPFHDPAQFPAEPATVAASSSSEWQPARTIGTDATPQLQNIHGQQLIDLITQSGGLVELKKKLEYEAIAYTLKETKGNITKAADRLGMKRPRLSQIISASDALIALKKESQE
ncbi:MAG: sigma 54-interacting transcriptional regulator, partial [Bradymonadia bacterium]